MPGAGIEPTRPCGPGILSPNRPHQNRRKSGDPAALPSNLALSGWVELGPLRLRVLRSVLQSAQRTIAVDGDRESHSGYRFPEFLADPGWWVSVKHGRLVVRADL